MPKNISKRKQTRNFLKSGQLEGQIKARQKRKAFEQKKKGRDARRNKGVLPSHQQPENDDASEDEFQEVQRKRKERAESEDDDDEEFDVDEVLGADGLDDESEQGEDNDDGASDLDDDDLSGLSGDEADGSDVDPAQHMADLKALAEKDPEFFKYLQENDAELLNFEGNTNVDAMVEDEDEEDEDEGENEDEDEGEDEKPKGKKAKGKEKATKQEKKKDQVLTRELLKSWQKSVLETRSFRSLRKLLIAFRSAAQSGLEPDMNNVDRERYEIQSPAVFNKLIVTALKYTPMVFSAQVPYKEVNGKCKLSTNSKSYATAQRLIKSYFVSLQSLLETTSSDSGIPALAVSESAKLVPWVVGNRKVARAWTKLLLGLYDSAADETRVAAFLALRKLAVAADHSLRETVIKGTYATLLASSRQTSMYTLPSITLMKNAASELFLLPGKAEGEQSYQLAFGYIRMLAILLRKGVKEGSKDAFKAVYNWQFVHAVDFWGIVLSASCDKERVAEKGESPLQQLLYPLIQVALGAIRLVPTSRYYPLRFHLIRSLLRIVQRTSTFIPLSTPLFEVLTSPELSKRSKPSTLKPLDWEYYLKCPTSYQRTRVYADALADEAVHLLTEYFGGSLSTSIAFPELALPAIVALKRLSKRTLQNKGQVKLSGLVKALVEKLEANSKWIEQKRDLVEFAPMKRDKVERFLRDEDDAKTPMGTHLKLMRRARDARKATLERGAQGGEDI
ncbi:hypothetical protein JCM10212_000422 [Sporobolomyces blumeae]